MRLRRQATLTILISPTLPQRSFPFNVRSMSLKLSEFRHREVSGVARCKRSIVPPLIHLNPHPLVELHAPSRY